MGLAAILFHKNSKMGKENNKDKVLLRCEGFIAYFPGKVKKKKKEKIPILQLGLCVLISYRICFSYKIKLDLASSLITFLIYFFMKKSIFFYLSFIVLEKLRTCVIVSVEFHVRHEYSITISCLLTVLKVHILSCIPCFSPGKRISKAKLSTFNTILTPSCSLI